MIELNKDNITNQQLLQAWAIEKALQWKGSHPFGMVKVIEAAEVFRRYALTGETDPIKMEDL